MGSAASDMIVCSGTAEQKAKLEAIKKEILSGKITTLNG
jgi:basic membrane protein A